MKTKKLPLEIGIRDAQRYLEQAASIKILGKYRGVPDEDILERRMLVGKMWLEGWTVNDTARQLETNPTMISRDRAWIMAQWINLAMEDASKIVARIVQQLEHMNRELWEQWHRSKKAKRRRKYKRDDDGKSSEAVVDGRLGDPRYLEQIRKNLETMIGLLGIDDEKNKKQVVGLLEAMKEAAAHSKRMHEQRLPESTVDQELEEYQ